MKRNRLNSIFKFSLLLFFLLFVFASCQKEKLEFTFSEISTHTSLDLEGIIFLNDTLGFTCGGTRYDSGVLLKTIDGGLNWESRTTSSMIKELYNFSFPSEDTGFCCGYDGKIFSTVDAGETWNFTQTNAWKPLRSICMFSSTDGLSCGGIGFQNGCIVNFFKDNIYWKVDSANTEYRDMIFFDRSTGVMCGYGKIVRTADGGNNWIITEAKQDFFVSMSFVNNQVGYAIGYTGSILKTSDGGETWDRLRNANSLFRPAKYFNKVVFRDANTGYIIGENGCFMKTTDGGKIWNEIKNAPEINLKAICLFKGGGIICGEEGKMYRFIEP